MRQPAAQLPQPWKTPPAYELHEDAKTWQVIAGVELDQLIGSCVPDQIIKGWPAGIRVVKAFKMDGNEGSMQDSAGSGTSARCARSTSVARTTMVRLLPGCASAAIAMTAR